MRLYWLIAVAVPCLFPPAARVTAEESPAADSPVVSAAKNVATAPGTSPVETFRKLLAMTSAARERFLTNYPPEKRGQILQKVREYETLPVETRELRLRVTELRWYLVPLLRAPPEQRAELLNLVPEPYKQWVATRLDEWDMWPPGLKDEVLEYETTMHYFIGRNAEVQRPAVFEDLPEEKQLDLELKLADWNALPLGQRQQMYGSFRHYFELSDAEQQKILATLSEAEREKTEQVVNSIESWPKSRQEAYLAVCRQYVEMSLAERRNFMKNAQHWQRMAPAERQAWRDLVQQLSMARTLAAGPVPLALPIGPRLPQISKTNLAGTAVK